MSPPSPTAFTWEPLFLALTVVAAVPTGARRGASGCRPGGWPLRRRPFLIAVALNSPLETLSADYLLVMHLLQNVVIADWAPPLLVLGLTPRMRRRSRGAAAGPSRS